MYITSHRRIEFKGKIYVLIVVFYYSSIKDGCRNYYCSFVYPQRATLMSNRAPAV